MSVSQGKFAPYIFFFLGHFSCGLDRQTGR